LIVIKKKRFLRFTAMINDAIMRNIV